ncbi:beta-lactamase [Streptomyces sp. 150FB]|nr:beta-lactamase [Streptomyces sp. 150FB]
MAGIGAALLGCAMPPSSAPARTPAKSAPRPAPGGTARAEKQLAALEARFGGRLGVYALDTGTGREVRHRADERFLLCSTHKALAVAAILRARRLRPGLLDTVIHYDSSELVSNSPVTGEHLDEGMTVAALCEAAITVSDNTAANLLVRVLGGPRAVTRFVSTLGDPVTRVDRTEPELNEATGDLDTTTPGHIGADLRALTLGQALDPAGRDLLVGWLTANTTGGEEIRAGVPAGWRVADKTGSGNNGESNDIAVVYPPGRAPLILAVYTAPTDPDSTAGSPTIAQAARIVAEALVPGA